MEGNYKDSWLKASILTQWSFKDFIKYRRIKVYSDCASYSWEGDINACWIIIIW